MVYRIYSVDGGTTYTAANDKYLVYFEQYGDKYSPEMPPRDVYLSGYLPRYQKRQLVGYHSVSGDLRSIEVNASGHVLTDIEIEASSGLCVQISGQHIFVESGTHVVVGAAIVVGSGTIMVESGLHVQVSGQHVYVESGVGVIISSGAGVEAYDACATKIRTGRLYPVVGGSSGTYVAASSGGAPITVSGEWCSGFVHMLKIKNLDGNDPVFIGDSGCRPFSGWGYWLGGNDEVTFDICNPANVYVCGCISGNLISWMGTDY